MQVPATSARSINATRFPAFTKSDDSGFPACPDPRINTSYCSAIAPSIPACGLFHAAVFLSRNLSILLEARYGEQGQQNGRSIFQQRNRQILYPSAGDTAPQPITGIRPN